MDELDLLADARPTPPPSPEVIVEARARLTAAFTQPAQPRPVQSARLRPQRRATNRRRWALVPAAIGAVALASVIALARIGDGPSGTNTGPDTVPSELTARDILLTAAEKTVKYAPSDTGRYWTAKKEEGSIIRVGAKGAEYGIMGRTEETSWYSLTATDHTWFYTQWVGAAPASDADLAAWKSAGSPADWPKDPLPNCPADPSRQYTTSAGPVRAVVSPPGASTFTVVGDTVTAEQARALPTDAAQLKTWLTEAVKRDGRPAGTATELNESIFASVAWFVFNTPLPAQVRAAAYRVLADLPDVRTVGAVRDAKGRAGVAVAIVQNDTPDEQLATDGGPYEFRLVFDRDSGQPLASEYRHLQPSGEMAWIKAGTLTAYSALLDTKWTDDAPPPAADVTEPTVKDGTGSRSRYAMTPSCDRK